MAVVRAQSRRNSWRSARRDGSYLYCHRPGCVTVLARVRDDYILISDTLWGRRITLDGEGWHRGDDAVWRAESHARRETRRGFAPNASHPRITERAAIDRPDLLDPADPHGYDLFGRRGHIAGDLVLARSGGVGNLGSDDKVECPRCRAVNAVDVRDLDPIDNPQGLRARANRSVDG